MIPGDIGLYIHLVYFWLSAATCSEFDLLNYEVPCGEFRPTILSLANEIFGRNIDNVDDIPVYGEVSTPFSGCTYSKKDPP